MRKIRNKMLVLLVASSLVYATSINVVGSDITNNNSSVILNDTIIDYDHGDISGEYGFEISGNGVHRISGYVYGGYDYHTPMSVASDFEGTIILDNFNAVRRFIVPSTAKVTFKLVGNNILQNGINFENAVVEYDMDGKPKKMEEQPGYVIITSDKDGDGKWLGNLTVSSGTSINAIGSSKYNFGSGNNIEIKGGDIRVLAGSGGIGIGGSNCENIVITDGNIVSYGGSDPGRSSSPAIGGYYNAKNIFINGGKIYALTPLNVAIGANRSEKIYVNGGDIYVYGKEGIGCFPSVTPVDNSIIIKGGKIVSNVDLKSAQTGRIDNLIISKDAIVEISNDFAIGFDFFEKAINPNYTLHHLYKPECELTIEEASSIKSVRIIGTGGAYDNTYDVDIKGNTICFSKTYDNTLSITYVTSTGEEKVLNGTIKNGQFSYVLPVNVVDENGNLLDGVVYDIDGVSQISNIIQKEMMLPLSDGEYSVTVKTVPNLYVKPKTIRFTVKNGQFEIGSDILDKFEIVIPKKNEYEISTEIENNESVVGINFEIEGDITNKFEESQVFTSDGGNINKVNLAEGKYSVKLTNVPVEYKIPMVEFRVDRFGNIIEIFGDTNLLEYTGNKLKIKLNLKEYRNIINIKDENKNILMDVEGVIKNNKDEIISDLSTNVVHLKKGNYKIEIKRLPKGYEIETIEFEVSGDGTVSSLNPRLSYGTGIINIEPELTKYIVNFESKDENNNVLEVTGTIKDERTANTYNIDNIIKSVELTKGEYTLEITPKIEYEKAQVRFKINGEGNIEILSGEADVNINNILSKIVLKRFENTIKIVDEKGSVLQGVTGKIVEKTTNKEYVFTNNTINRLPKGSYTLNITEMPVGYEKENIVFEINELGVLSVTTGTVTGNVAEIKAKLTEYPVNIDIKDENNLEIKGIGFKVTNVDTKKEEINITSAGNIKLPKGNYSIEITNLPKEYESKIYKFTVQPDGKLLTSDIEIKINASNINVGVLFKQFENTIKIVDEKGSVLQGVTGKIVEKTTNKEYVFTNNAINRLPKGSYTLNITEMPVGYEKENIAFEIDELGVLTVTTGIVTGNVAEIKAKLTEYPVNIDIKDENNLEIKGIGFKVTNVDTKKEEINITSAGNIKLPKGNYSIEITNLPKEYENKIYKFTVQPDGKLLTSDIEIKINASNINVGVLFKQFENTIKIVDEKGSVLQGVTGKIVEKTTNKEYVFTNNAINRLPKGSYTLNITEMPVGYEKENILFEINELGVLTVTTGTVSGNVAEIKAKLTEYPVNIDIKDENNLEIKGISYKIKNADNTEVTGNLSKGDYSLEIVNLPKGYENKIYKFTVQADGKITTTDKDIQVDGINVKVTVLLERFNVSFKVLDENKVKLIPKVSEIKEITSGKVYGNVDLTKLPKGSYELKLELPVGYENQTIKFEISETGTLTVDKAITNVKVNLNNEVEINSILTKYKYTFDIKDENGKVIKGIDCEIKNLLTNQVEKIGNILELTKGKYKIEFTSFPMGYEKDDKLEFTVQPDGKIITVNKNIKLENNEIKINVDLKRFEKGFEIIDEKKNPITNLKMKIVDENEKEYPVFSKIKLTKGNYRLVIEEIETGYEKEEITFSIDELGKITSSKGKEENDKLIVNAKLSNYSLTFDIRDENDMVIAKKDITLTNTDTTVGYKGVDDDKTVEITKGEYVLEITNLEKWYEDINVSFNVDKYGKIQVTSDNARMYGGKLRIRVNLKKHEIELPFDIKDELGKEVSGIKGIITNRDTNKVVLKVNDVKKDKIELGKGIYTIELDLSGYEIVRIDFEIDENGNIIIKDDTSIELKRKIYSSGEMIVDPVIEYRYPLSFNVEKDIKIKGSIYKKQANGEYEKVKEIDENSIIYLEKGEYILKIDETSEGYNKPKDIKFVVYSAHHTIIIDEKEMLNKENKLKIELEKEKIESIKDNSNKKVTLENKKDYEIKVYEDKGKIKVSFEFKGNYKGKDTTSYKKNLKINKKSKKTKELKVGKDYEVVVVETENGINSKIILKGNYKGTISQKYLKEEKNKKTNVTRKISTLKKKKDYEIKVYESNGKIKVVTNYKGKYTGKFTKTYKKNIVIEKEKQNKKLEDGKDYKVKVYETKTGIKVNIELQGSYKGKIIQNHSKKTLKEKKVIK